VIELCRLIRERQLTITWNAISRVDYIDDDILMAMRKAGCIQISYGVESGAHRRLRKTLGKPVSEDSIIRAFKKTTAFGIMPRVYLIYGSPGESMDTIGQSIALMEKIAPLSAVFYMLVTFPRHLSVSGMPGRKLPGISDSTWNDRIEDLPWFEMDSSLDFDHVRNNGGHGCGLSFTNSFPVMLSPLNWLMTDPCIRFMPTFSPAWHSPSPMVITQQMTESPIVTKPLKCCLRQALRLCAGCKGIPGPCHAFPEKKRFQKSDISCPIRIGSLSSP
jgi:anaerobic magnesium-protoporphyrin IX monomethyl ester cyclase